MSDDGAPAAGASTRNTWLALTIGAVAAFGVAPFLLQGADGPADPAPAPSRVAAPDTTGASPTPPADVVGSCAAPDRTAAVPFDGFGEIGFAVTGADGSTSFEGCAHLAATPETRARGLMAQRDLAGYDAMVFSFDQPGTGAFYMFRTVLPLSIAYIGADGALVSSTDMDPCTEADASACPTFPPAGPYLHAIEVVQGDLGRLGIVPGATVTFGEPRT